MVAVALSGLITAQAFPAIDLGFLAWLSLAPLFFHGLVSHQQFTLQFLQLVFIRCAARGCSTFRGIRGNQLETGFCDRRRYLGGTLCRLQQATRLAPRRVLCPGFT